MNELLRIISWKCPPKEIIYFATGKQFPSWPIKFAMQHFMYDGSNRITGNKTAFEFIEFNTVYF